MNRSIVNEYFNTNEDFYDKSACLFVEILRQAKDETIIKIIKTIIGDKKSYKKIMNEFPRYRMFVLYHEALSATNPSPRINSILQFFEVLLILSLKFKYYEWFNYSDNCYSNYYMSCVEALANAIIDSRCIMYWEFEKDNTVKLYYTKFENIEKNSFWYYNTFKEITVKKEKDNIELVDNGVKKIVEGIHIISNKFKRDKFLTTYKVIANTIFHEEYCPWCNPNPKLAYRRRCAECNMIMDVLVPPEKYNKLALRKERNRFNTNLQRQKVENNLINTIQVRGRYLLDKLKIVENQYRQLHCEEMLSVEIKRVKEIIKTRYKLDK